MDDESSNHCEGAKHWRILTCREFSAGSLAKRISCTTTKDGVVRNGPGGDRNWAPHRRITDFAPHFAYNSKYWTPNAHPYLAAALIIGAVNRLCQTRLKGIVTDAPGAAIANAMVLIHWDSDGSTVGLASNVGIKEDLVMRTKADGTFEVDLPPGFYDIFTSAMAFSPACRKVRMKGSETQEIKLRLKPDALYTAEMGNRVKAAPPKR